MYFNTTKYTTGVAATQFSLADTSYNYTARVSAGQMSAAEATSTQPIKFQILRTNYTNIQNVNIVSLATWTETLRPLIYTQSNAYGNITIAVRIQY